MSRNDEGDGDGGYWDASNETGKSAKGTSRGRSCGSAKWSDGRQSGKGWAGDDYNDGARRSNYSWNRGGKPYRDVSGKSVGAASPPPPPPGGAGSSADQVAPDIATMATPRTPGSSGFAAAGSSIPAPPLELRRPSLAVPRLAALRPRFRSQQAGS